MCVCVCVYVCVYIYVYIILKFGNLYTMHKYFNYG